MRGLMTILRKKLNTVYRLNFTQSIMKEGLLLKQKKLCFRSSKNNKIMENFFLFYIKKTLL